MVGVIDLDEVARIQLVRIHNRAVILVMPAPQDHPAPPHRDTSPLRCPPFARTTSTGPSASHCTAARCNNGRIRRGLPWLSPQRVWWGDGTPPVYSATRQAP